MSDAEHLIENIILAMIRGDDADEELQKPHNQAMLQYTGISPGDLYAMAWHVVHVLYEGVSPDQKIPPDKFYDEMLEILKDSDQEERHARADGLMCDVLEENGFEDGVAVFRMMPKRYA